MCTPSPLSAGGRCRNRIHARENPRPHNSKPQTFRIRVQGLGFRLFCWETWSSNCHTLDAEVLEKVGLGLRVWGNIADS